MKPLRKVINRWKKQGIEGQALTDKIALAKANRQKRRDAAAMGELFGTTNMEGAAALVNQFIPPESLGRVDTGIMSRDAAGNIVRIPENQEVLNRYKDLADQGYSSQEFQGLREQQQRGMNSALATSMAQLGKAQARGKVYGAAASAQQANALRADKENRSQLEQDLFLKGAEFKRSALGEYAGTLKGMQEGELERQKVNLGQTTAEKAAQLGAFFNAIGIGMGKELSQEQLDLAREAIQKGLGISF